jgi:hypothetical protein
MTCSRLRGKRGQLELSGTVSFLLQEVCFLIQLSHALQVLLTRHRQSLFMLLIEEHWLRFVVFEFKLPANPLDVYRRGLLPMWLARFTLVTSQTERAFGMLTETFGICLDGSYVFSLSLADAMDDCGSNDANSVSLDSCCNASSRL